MCNLIKNFVQNFLTRSRKGCMMRLHDVTKDIAIVFLQFRHSLGSNLRNLTQKLRKNYFVTEILIIDVHTSGSRMMINGNQCLSNQSNDILYLEPQSLPVVGTRCTVYQSSSPSHKRSTIEFCTCACRRDSRERPGYAALV